jgi:2-polyprenyl-3-methyl-5-hydroxy-6-metoxy-1,4-benzoquinol methylase
MVSKDYKAKIRIFELDFLTKEIEPGSSILEIGSGAGWQAKELEKRGFKVSAIDVAQTTFRNIQVFNVIDYGGKIIPFDDEVFDVVFSSNVLEHIPHVIGFQTEIARVLKKNGKVVHFVPNFYWRFWTTINHFPYVVLRLIKWPFGSSSTSSNLDIPSEVKTTTNKNKTKFIPLRLLRFLIPRRHGERGNVITEHYYFSRFYWKKVFKNTAWKLISVAELPLFHTGNYLFGEAISIKGRNRMTKIFGGTTDIYIMEKEVEQNEGH